MHKRATQIIAAGKKHGWQGIKTQDGKGLLGLELSRKDEQLKIAWDLDILLHPIVYVLKGVKRQELPSAMAAIRILEGEPDYTRKRSYLISRKQKSEKTDKVSSGEDIVAAELPFDVISSGDKEIIRFLRGKTVVWRKSNGEIKSGMIPPRYKTKRKDGMTVWRTNPNISLSVSKAGRRVLTWPDLRIGFVSCGLDQILRIH